MKYTKEQKELVVKLRKQGLTYSQICIESGVRNLTTAHNICYEAGLPREARTKTRIKYIPGMRFFNFIAVEPSPTKTSKIGRTYTCWKCLCDCGKEFIATCKEMSKGARKSCGCLSRDSMFKAKDGNTVIGKSKFDHYKNSAKRRDLSWELSLEEFIKMLYSNCYYCNSPPLLLVKRSIHERMVNGVDRINSDLGYFSENCVPCCKFCNLGKGVSTKQEFLEWIERIKTYEGCSN